jgi:hypothetical protein
MSDWLKIKGVRVAKKMKKMKLGDWNTAVTLGLTVRRKSTILHIGVTGTGGGEWTVVALTTPTKTKGVQAVLDQHSHKVIGEDLEFHDAVKAAETYARAWRPGREADCPCDEIKGAAQTKPLARRSKVRTRNPPRHA